MSQIREPDAVMRYWPNAERPVERLIQHGAAALSDAELLAVMLRSGTKTDSAVDVARKALTNSGGLTGILTAPESSGFSADAVARLGASMEIARRVLREQMSRENCLQSPRAVRDYLLLLLSGKPREEFVALFLDAQQRVIASETLFAGTLTQTSVYPREVVKAALRNNAAAVIFAHNHPSGVAEPSGADELLTRTLKSALALVDVQVLDHFIVAGDSAMSFAERGLL